MALGVSGRLFDRQLADRATRSTLDNLADRWVAEAESAAAIYTVTSCGAGPCAALRFMAFDAHRRPVFWGYEFAAGALQRCRYDAAEAPCKHDGAALPLRTFEARLVRASSLQLAIAPGYRAADRLYRMLGSADDPGGRVVGGNRLVQIEFASEIAGRTIDLLPGAKPFDASAVVAYVTPPPAAQSPTASPCSSNCGQTAVYAGATYSEFYCWGEMYQNPHGGYEPTRVDIVWNVYYFTQDAGQTWGGFTSTPVPQATCLYPPEGDPGNVHEWWGLPNGASSHDPPVDSPLADTTSIDTQASGGAGYRSIVLSDGFLVTGDYVMYPGQTATVVVTGSPGTSLEMTENAMSQCDGYVSVTPEAGVVQNGAVATYTVSALKPTGGINQPKGDTFPTCDMAWAADSPTGIAPQATFIGFAVVPEGTPLQ